MKKYEKVMPKVIIKTEETERNSSANSVKGGTGKDLSKCGWP